MTIRAENAAWSNSLGEWKRRLPEMGQGGADKWIVGRLCTQGSSRRRDPTSTCSINGLCQKEVRGTSRSRSRILAWRNSVDGISVF